MADAEPQSDAERAVYEETEAVLAEAPAILELLSSYKGCGELIRQAINNPGDDTQNAAWEGVLPMVEQLRDVGLLFFWVGLVSSWIGLELDWFGFEGTSREGRHAGR